VRESAESVSGANGKIDECHDPTFAETRALFQGEAPMRGLWYGRSAPHAARQPPRWIDAEAGA
jgi:hypothetical protein